MRKYLIKTFLITTLITLAIWFIAILLNILVFDFKLFRIQEIISLVVISYFIITIFPSLMYYYYGIYYPKYGNKIAKDPVGEVLFIIFSGYYCILFYVKGKFWFFNREKMLREKDEALKQNHEGEFYE